jgi:hypothetical protein
MQVSRGRDVLEETCGDCSSSLHLFCISSCVMTCDASPLPITPLRKGDSDTQVPLQSSPSILQSPSKLFRINR